MYDSGHLLVMKKGTSFLQYDEKTPNTVTITMV